MIRLFDNYGCEVPIEKVKFPDNSCFFKIKFASYLVETFFIIWNYESDEEFLHVAYIKNHLVSKTKAPVVLGMPYIPNARMDRTKDSEEVFTLHTFAKLINSLNFSSVWCFDPHSHVSEALFDRLHIYNPNSYIENVLKEFFKLYPTENPIIYYSDYSAMKRYHDLGTLKNLHYLYGAKVREWGTGKITGLDIIDENNNKITKDYKYLGSKVILIDDIISYGGTMYYGINGLIENGMDPVFVYATHTEQSSFHDEEKGKLKKIMSERNMKLFTTDSIYRGETEDNITIFKIF